MSTPPRQRIFGSKPVTTARLASTRPVGTAEIRHDGRKLIGCIVFSAVASVVSFWTIAAGGFGADHHGRVDLPLGHLIGPRGITFLVALCGICCALLVPAYLRLLISRDRSAARATADGVAINGLWGRKSYAWRDVTAIRLHITKPRSREIVFIRIEHFDGGCQLVSTSTVAGGRGEVESWIQQVQSYLHR